MRVWSDFVGDRLGFNFVVCRWDFGLGMDFRLG